MNGMKRSQRTRPRGLTCLMHTRRGKQMQVVSQMWLFKVSCGNHVEERLGHGALPEEGRGHFNDIGEMKMTT